MTGSVTKKAASKANRRDAIVEAARKRFRKTGLAEATLDMIAADATISRPNLYRFFKNKSELVTAVLVAESRAINEKRINKVAKEKTFEDKVVCAFQTTVETMKKNKFWTELISPENVPYTAYVARNDADVNKTTEEFWLPILEMGEASGQLRSDVRRSDMLKWLLGLEFMFMERDEIFTGPKDLRQHVTSFVLPSLTGKLP